MAKRSTPERTAKRRRASNQQKSAAMERVIPFTQVRQNLSPLIKKIERQRGSIGIAIHGRVRAYLVASERFEEFGVEASRRHTEPSARSPIRGSLRITGSLDQGSRKAAKELIHAARELASELGE